MTLISAGDFLTHQKPFETENNTRLLIVDDDEDSLSLLQSLSEKWVNSISLAKNGVEGLKEYRASKPDIVVTDIDMPEMDGLAFAEEIRREDKEIPIIIMTAHTNEEFLLKAINIGVNDYIIKPVKKTSMRMMITRYTRQAQQKKEISYQRNLIQMILDKNPTYILITDGHNAHYINRSFLDYLTFSSFEEFQKHYKSLSDLIIPLQEDESEKGDFEKWFERIKAEEEENHYVELCYQCNSENFVPTFLLHFFPIPNDDNFILFFTEITHLMKEKNKYRNLATTDNLTGIANRKQYTESLDLEMQRATHAQHALSLIIIDIDYFKYVNDTYGHQVGDQVLRELAQTIQKNIRKTDIFARYGGEEFVILAPDCNLQCAKLLAEKIRKKVEEHEFQTAGRITCSFGISQYEPEEKADFFFQRADKALYRAKGDGRNRIYSSPGTQQ